MWTHHVTGADSRFVLKGDLATHCLMRLELPFTVPFSQLGFMFTMNLHMYWHIFLLGHHVEEFLIIIFNFQELRLSKIMIFLKGTPLVTAQLRFKLRSANSLSNFISFHNCKLSGTWKIFFSLIRNCKYLGKMSV